ncbi:MAG TPA: hypothetical protein PKC69_13400 [Chitinophagaceae bacterium]|nr:hypothetical protein [Chitinophagaceae bacterium]
MERIETLINRLREQYDQKADAAQLMMTLQLLQQELQSRMKAPRTLGTSKVAVVMPSGSHADAAYFEKYAPRPAAKEEEVVIAVVPPEEAPVLKPVQEELQQAAFDPLVEIPTLSQHASQGKKQNAEAGSLNDKLKKEQTELFHILKETPVKDLRKAIGINDRFLFINDLFRGDEAMYERSIKTINSFNIYAEAEYWISRELKVKLGWDDENESVAQFDQLVKRRFS